MLGVDGFRVRDDSPFLPLASLIPVPVHVMGSANTRLPLVDCPRMMGTTKNIIPITRRILVKGFGLQRFFFGLGFFLT